MSFYKPTTLWVHTQRLIENFQALRALYPENPFLCPMVKANAYGHGDVIVARALNRAGCQSLGVSSVEEGLRLREQSISGDILVFGFQGKEAAQALVEKGLQPVVSNFEQFHDLSQATSQPCSIHIKLDTGMHRLGFQAPELESLGKLLEKHPNLKMVGVGTHFHTGSEVTLEGSRAWEQLRLFQEMIPPLMKFKPLVHAHNSAAIVALYKKGAPFEFGWRPGLLVYGIDPGENLSLKPLLGPVMKFTSQIVSLQPVKSGEVVSYGGMWQALRDSLIGIVPAGYADGVCVSLSNRGEFLVKGQRVPIRGQVSMDYTMVDLTDLKGENWLGEEVVLVGPQGSEEISVEEMAQKAGRLTYELITGIGPRSPRIDGTEGIDSESGTVDL